ncbi:MAG: TetR/AcrR family transcriptional regulator [Myxococcales bacterium]|nr:TetR/AcrR family transcriptional regulator [Myxococcales bacterium]
MEKRRPRERPTKTASARALGPEAWLAAAWEALARGGVEGVRVEPLAARLGVTKGSFYWHFRDRAALLDALLEDWERRATLGVIARVDASSEAPRARLAELLRVTTGAPEAPDAEHAIRAWGAHDPSAGARLARVDERRERYVEDLLVSAGVTRAKAKHRARALYLTLIGEYARVSHGGAPTSPATWAELLERMLPDTAPARPTRPRAER